MSDETKTSDWTAIGCSLDGGELVILPTETVFGLAASAASPHGISNIYKAKGRSFDKPLAICVKDLEQAELIGVFNKASRDLALKYWPGPLTLVVDVQENSGLDDRLLGNINGDLTVGIRCPDVYWREHINRPIALTSANQSGQSDCTSIDDIPDSICDNVMWELEAEQPLSGRPSTIARVKGNKISILRQGELDIEI